LDEQDWIECVNIVKALIDKQEELLSVLRSTQSDFKQFFSWLYHVIVEKSNADDDEGYDRTSKTNDGFFHEFDQMRLASILREHLNVRNKCASMCHMQEKQVKNDYWNSDDIFNNNSDNTSSSSSSSGLNGNGKHFASERVGQYFRNIDLRIPILNDINNFDSDNSDIANDTNNSAQVEQSQNKNQNEKQNQNQKKSNRSSQYESIWKRFASSIVQSEGNSFDNLIEFGIYEKHKNKSLLQMFQLTYKQVVSVCIYVCA